MVVKSLFTVRRTISAVKQSSKCMSITVRKQSVWTQDKVIKSPYNPIEIPNCTVYEYVWQNLDKWPERTASVCALTGRGYTYEDAFKLSNTFAANLRNKLKVRDGDVVAIMLPNIPDYPVVALGILEAGGIITSINPINTANEVQRQLTMSGAKMIVTLPQLVPAVAEALKISKLKIPIIVVKTSGEPTPEGTFCFNELSEDVYVDKSCLKEVRRSVNDICLLPYSSGTTGMPKGVELSHRNIIANMEQISDPLIGTHNDTTKTHQDAAIGVLPFFHIYAATVVMFHKMSVGVKLVALPKFQPETFLQALENYKTNIVMVAPPLVLLMASHPAATEKSLQYIETVINGAAPLAISDIERFFDRVKRKLDFRQGYGLTETSPTVTFGPKGSTDYKTAGPPVPNTELRIVDLDLKNLGPNETGEILVRGPQVMRGYRNDPQANNEAFTTDGWFRTGDLAVADENGSIIIVDRLKELIKVKGFQVPPAELEAILREHPLVNDAAVVGIPHRIKGETPKAFVVLKPGRKCNENDIKNYVNDKVSSYKKVDDIIFVDAVPKSAAGKILRRVLKEKYC